MALTVGELNGIITIDDRAMNPALRRAENALRQTGDRMGDDAERAGQQAGQQLGQGLVRGADGQWRNLRGELVDAVTAARLDAEAEAHRAGQQVGAGVVRGADGRLRDLRGRFVTATRQAGDGATTAARRAGDDAGDALADGLTDGGERGGEGATDEAVSGLERLKVAGAGVAAAAGAAIAAALVDAMGQAMEQSRITGRLVAQLGKTPAEAQRYGKIAGELYSDAITEDFQGAADSISAIMAAGLVPPDATNAQIKSIATRVSDLATTFDQDLGQTANAVGQILKTGLAKDGREAVDVLTKGLQQMGPRADDLMDTFNEYSTQFRNMGLDAKTATGLLSQGMQAGARDTDVVADAIKEFSIEAVAGGGRVKKGFESLGLSADDMVEKFAAGGPTAAKAFDTVLDRLRGIEDPAKRNAVAIELFGTKAEDMGDALYALDPSTAVDTLGKVGGAADKMGDALRDNAGTRVEQFKRGLQQGLVDFLGTQVIPALTEAKAFLGGLWDDAGKGGKEGADRVIAFFGLIAQRFMEKAKELAPRAIEALSGVGQKIADWIMSNPEQALKLGAIAAAIVAALITLPLLVAGGIAAAATLIMVGFTKKLISSLQENLPKWLSAFGTWLTEKTAQIPGMFNVLGTAIGRWFSTLWSRYIAGPVSRQWNSWMTSVRGLPGRSVAALNPLGGNLSGVASRAWQRFKDTAAQKGDQFITWVRGLPRRIASNLGSLGSLLTPQGRAVVQGLWAGISSMGGWISSKLIGWAKSVIPGPIAKALGIASPSKVTKAQGRWIARGLIDGLTGSTKQVKAASQKLADIVADSMKPGKKRSKALKRISSDTKKLLKLAGQEERVATRLKTAQKRLADQMKARDKLAADVKKGILDSANITSQDTGGWPQTAESILAGLKQDRAAAEAFAKNLATLRKKGVRADLIAQIAQAGVEQGSSAAAALANANATQIKQINAEQAALVKTAGAAGNAAGNAMYGAGIQAANGMVKGLQSRQKLIEKQMLAIARGMSKAIRKALGIKSPSRVMARVGAFTAQGLVRGLEGERRAVNRSMASLVDTPAGSWDMASGRARAAAAQKVVLEFRSSGRGEDDYLMGRMQRGVRKIAGPDVQYAFTGRRSR